MGASLLLVLLSITFSQAYYYPYYDCDYSGYIFYRPYGILRPPTERPGHCPVTPYCNFWIPEFLSYRFLCYNDWDCRENTKCCNHNCYRHPVCLMAVVPPETTEATTRDTEATTRPTLRPTTKPSRPTTKPTIPTTPRPTTISTPTPPTPRPTTPTTPRPTTRPTTISTPTPITPRPTNPTTPKPTPTPRPTTPTTPKPTTKPTIPTVPTTTTQRVSPSAASVTKPATPAPKNTTISQPRPTINTITNRPTTPVGDDEDYDIGSGDGSSGDREVEAE